ncbi:MAG: response regulator [Polyangiaceae bacterium]
MHRIEPPTERFTTDLERTPLVLLAEDDGDTRAVLNHILRDGGYAVVEAVHGLELMSMLAACVVDEARTPDYIVSDIRMPFFTGLDALESSLKTHLDAPIVLISAFCDPATVSRALEAGAAALLPKPVEPEALLETLESLSGLRATLPSA